MGQNCLERRTVKALAAGRCSKAELAIVRRHLPNCMRCRAAVVAAAAGVRGPGETVLLKRPRRGVPTGLKLAAVAVSLLLVGGAWRYGALAKSDATPARSAIAAEPQLEPARAANP